jgi:hypothetical protein
MPGWHTNRPKGWMFIGVILLVLLAPVSICGCSSTAGQLAARPHCVICDVTDKAGYLVAAVDGKPVERFQSHWYTVIPYAILEPGVHTLTLVPDVPGHGAAKTITVTLEAGKRYNLKAEADTVMVAEEKDSGSETPRVVANNSRSQGESPLRTAAPGKMGTGAVGESEGRVGVR